MGGASQGNFPAPLGIEARMVLKMNLAPFAIIPVLANCSFTYALPGARAVSDNGCETGLPVTGDAPPGPPQSSECAYWQRAIWRAPRRAPREDSLGRKGRKIRSTPRARRNGAYTLGRILPPRPENLPPRGEFQSVVYSKTIVVESAQVTFKVCATPGHRLTFIGPQIMRVSSASFL